MITMRQPSMLHSTWLSIVLHILALLFILFWGFANPFRPNEIVFDQIEMIDSETFDALVAQTQAGSAGEDAADAPSASQATQAEEAEVVSEEVVAPEVEEVEVEIEPAPAPAPAPPQVIDPLNLPEPIFDPAQAEEPQPLPQVSEAEESGLADPESDGQEQAFETTNLPTPPARDASALAQIAQAAQEEEASEIAETEEVEAEIAPQEDNQEVAQSELDATSEVRPEADLDAPISSAPAVAIVPPSRPSQLVAPEAAQIAQSDSQGSVETSEAENPEQVSPQADTTNVVDAPIEEIASEGVIEAPVDGSAEDSTIEDLLASVLEEQDGAQASGRGLTQFEEAALTQKIHNNWVKTTFIEKPNYQDLEVVVRFATDRYGNLIDNIRLLHPENATPDYIIAYEAARNAILISMPLEMPADIDPGGLIWTLKFDPSRNNVGRFQ